jgi:hypothetical protein
LDAFNIKQEAIDPATLENMFPNADGSGGKINSFVNWLRFESGSVVMGVRAGFPAFFTEVSPGSVQLKDSIEVSGVVYSCSPSSSPCWNALKLYFDEQPGITEMQQVGAALHNQAATSRELEQSLCRIRLCNVDSGTETLDNANTICPGLAMQVAQQRQLHPSLVCSAFAFGPGTTAVCSQGGAVPSGNGGAAIMPNAAMAISVLVIINLLL